MPCADRIDTEAERCATLNASNSRQASYQNKFMGYDPQNFLDFTAVSGTAFLIQDSVHNVIRTHLAGYTRRI